MREHLIDTPAGSVRVRILGAGPPVVCLHGVSAQGRSWTPVARRLAHRATFWMPDLLGRGGSAPRPDLRFGLDEEVARAVHIVEALRDALAAGDPASGHAPFPAVIAGHSQGAAIGLALAAREPAVRSLLLSNPVTPWTRRPRVLDALASAAVRRLVAGVFSPLRQPLARAILLRAGGPGFRPPPEMAAAYAEPYADRRRAETLMALLRDWRPGELTDRLPEPGRRVAILAGALDPRIAVESAERLAAELGATLEVVPGGGHVLPEQHPDLVARALESLLDPADPDPGSTSRPVAR